MAGQLDVSEPGTCVLCGAIGDVYVYTDLYCAGCALEHHHGALQGLDREPLEPVAAQESGGT